MWGLGFYHPLNMDVQGKIQNLTFMAFPTGTDLREPVGRKNQWHVSNSLGSLGSNIQQRVHLPLRMHPSSRPHPGEPSPKGLHDSALSQFLPSLLSGFYLGTVFFFFLQGDRKECQDYWCIKWLRNVCHSKPFYFLPDATKKLFNKVSLSFF